MAYFLNVSKKGQVLKFRVFAKMLCSVGKKTAFEWICDKALQHQYQYRIYALVFNNFELIIFLHQRPAKEYNDCWFEHIRSIARTRIHTLLAAHIVTCNYR